MSLRREAGGRRTTLVHPGMTSRQDGRILPIALGTNTLKPSSKTANVTIQPRFGPATAFPPGRETLSASVEFCLTLENCGEPLLQGSRQPLDRQR